jgi:hypothetical protein
MSQKRESKYVRFARLAYAVAQEGVPRYAHPKSPQRFTQPQLVVCLLLTQYLNVSYRKYRRMAAGKCGSSGGLGTDRSARSHHHFPNAQALDTATP